MKTICIKAATLAALASLGSLGVFADAQAGFSGPHAPANWAVASTGTLTGAPIVAPSAVFTSLQLALSGGNADTGCTGGTYGVAGPCQLQATIALPGVYSFDYAYETLDADGAGGDIFGVIVDGVRVSPAISDLGGAVSQSGTRSFAAGTSFGFFLNCTDCTGGRALVAISGFSVTPIPEPARLTLWLVGGLALASMAGRRNRAAQKAGLNAA